MSRERYVQAPFVHDFDDISDAALVQLGGWCGSERAIAQEQCAIIVLYSAKGQCLLRGSCQVAIGLGGGRSRELVAYSWAASLIVKGRTRTVNSQYQHTPLRDKAMTINWVNGVDKPATVMEDAPGSTPAISTRVLWFNVSWSGSWNGMEMS